MERGDGFTIAHRDELDRNGRWSLIRRTIEVGSFGINLVTIESGDDIPEHDETERDQEEVYLVLSGEASVIVDGQVHAAPTGTYARIAPERRRTVRNVGSSPLELLMISAPQTSGYEPMSWA
jgi:quercetin dioxygenase-like cupin family protein